MYDGFLRFAGHEVINMERLMAYVDNGIVPAGVRVRDCTGTCEDLGVALGDGQYTSPLVDEPDWFDPDNPDSLDFAGVLPLEITGLDGSFRTVDMQESVIRGAVATRPHYGPRTIAVSALLLGRTSQGVQVGLSWLADRLHRVCDPGQLCTGAELEAFTSCPTPICAGGEGADPDQELAPTDQDYSADTWIVTEGLVTPGEPDTLVTTAAEAGRNSLPNPSGEYGIAAWHKDPVNTAWGTAVPVQTTAPEPVKVGTKAVRLTFTALAGQVSAHSQQVTGLTAGKWYAYDTWLYVPSQQTANLLTANQSSMETDATGWTGTGAALTRVTTDFYIGAASLRAVWNGTASPNVTSTTVTGLVAGSRYRLTARVKVPTGSPHVKVAPVAGTLTDDSAATTTLNDTWQQVTCDFIAAATTAQVRATPTGTPDNLDEMFLDDVRVFLLGAPNSVTNTGFDTDASGWTAYGGAAIARVTTDAGVVPFVGAGMGKVTVPATGLCGVQYQMTGLTVGQVYRATARIWRPVTGGTAAVGMGVAPTNEYAPPLSQFGAWELAQLTFIAPITNPVVSFAATVNGTSTTTFYLDEVRVIPEAYPAMQPYVQNGATAGTGLLHDEPVTVYDQWVHRIQPFQALTTTAEVGVHTVGTNSSGIVYVDQGMVSDWVGGSIANHDFERGAEGWAGNSVFGSATPCRSVEASSDRALTGLRSLKITWETPAAGQMSNCYQNTPGLIGGRTYTATGWVYVPSGAPDVWFEALFHGGAPKVTIKDQWVQSTWSFTLPAGVTNAFLGLRTDVNPGTIGGTVAYIDDVLLFPDDGSLRYFDGDTPGGSDGSFKWAGTKGNSPSIWSDPDLTLVAGPSFPPQGRFVAQWQITPATTGPGITVWVGAVDLAGSAVLDQQGPYTLVGPGSTTLQWEVQATPNVVWRPAMWVLGDGGTFNLITYSAPTLTPEECIAPYRRLYSQVTTVAGPTVTGQEVTDCGERLLHVEWTWVAGSPYRYGTREYLATGATDTTPAETFQLGVISTPLGTIAATPYNCATPVPAVSCAPDPCYPGFTLPPAGPKITDPKRPNITTQQVKATAFYIPPEQVPQNEGVFTFLLANDDHDKVGLRVRVYSDFPGTTPPDLCDFDYEYLIDYIAPDATFAIDGVSGTGTVQCPGMEVPVDASGVVRGSYGGPVQDPVSGCARNYYVVAMWLATYPTTCTGFYTSGQDTGSLQATVAVAPREG